MKPLFVVVQRKVVLVGVAAVALFGVLGAWALGSPPASGPDERFHYGFIWCPDDVVSDTCLSVVNEDGGEIRVRYAVGDRLCFLGQPSRPAKCSDSRGSSETVIVRGAYPAGYYSVASSLVSQDDESSVLRIRMMNAAVTITLLTVTLLLADRRLRRALIVAVLISYGPLHLSLLSSTHHQSWSIAAITSGWALAVAAATAPDLRRRVWGLVFWVTGLALAASSRWEGGPYYLFTSLAAITPIFYGVFRRMRHFRSVMFAAASVLALVQIPNWPFSVRRWVTGVNSVPLNPAGPDVWTWLTSWLTHFPTVMMEVFGGGGMATDDIPIPELGPTMGPLLLGAICAFAVARTNRWQLAVAGTQLTVILFSILYYTNIELDLYTLPGRYVTPLVGVLVGVLIYQSQATSQFTDHTFLRRALFGLLFVFHAVALHSYLERFVVGSRPNFAPLSQTPDTWWWRNVALTPNQTVVFGTFFFGVLLAALASLLALRTEDDAGMRSNWP